MFSASCNALRLAAAVAFAVIAGPAAAHCGGCGQVPDQYAYEMKKWPAHERHAGAPAQVRFESHEHTRTLVERGGPLGQARLRFIRDDVARGANFAGAYRLIRDECRGCTSLLVVDLKTGQIYRLHLPDQHGISYFAVGSTLIAVAVVTKDGRRETIYFAFKNGEFRRVQAQS